MIDLGIVIVNWNTRDLLHRCLETVYASKNGLKFKVVVVDNASRDGSADMVRHDFPQAALIEQSANEGYSAANNRGLRWLGYPAVAGGTAGDDLPRYVLLLNPDTELPPSALQDMVTYLDGHPEVGVAGPKLVLPDGSLDLACRRSFPTPEVSFWRMIGFSKVFPTSRRFARYNLTFLNENEIAEVDSVVGAFMMVRQAPILRVGLLDESFFMYGEDLDWCKRIKESGWQIIYFPGVTVTHVKRAASRQSQRAQVEFVRAMLIFYNKHYRRHTSWLGNLAVLAGIAVQGGKPLWREVFSSPEAAGEGRGV